MFFGPPASNAASTPQKTLQSFITAFNRRDRRAMEALVKDSKHNPALEEAGDDRDKPGLLSARNIALKPLSATRATVAYLLEALPKGGKPKQSNQETIDMVKVGGNWLIVAPALDTKVGVGYLARVALMLVYPELIKLTPVMTKAEKARQNLKDIAIGAKMYIEDDDGKILLRPGDYHRPLYPYIRIPGVYTSPLDKPRTLSYLFNGNLTGRKLSSLKAPKNTVLFFEGKPQALSFRYDGKALVALADGSVRFVTPAEAKALLWK